MSETISNLEEQIGVQLFDRSGRYPKLTPAGSAMLGDARSNNLDPRADILRRIAERSKRVVWLNPEGRMAWGFGDSEMPRYATFCSVVRQCATAKQLERAVSDIVASYQ